MTISTYSVILTPTAATRSHLIINGFENSTDANAFGAAVIADVPTGMASYLTVPGPTVSAGGGAFDLRGGGVGGGGGGIAP